MNSPDDVDDTSDDTADDAINVEDAAHDTVDDTVELFALFRFLMHLVVICSSISHMIARLLVGSVVACFVHFCS